MQGLDHILAALAARRLGLLVRPDVIRAGGSDKYIRVQLAQHHWQQLHPGVYLTGAAPPTWLQRELAACLAGGPNAVASVRGAAAVWQLDGALEGAIELTVAQPHGPIPRPAVVHRTLRWDPVDRTVHRRVPVTSVNRTLIDYGSKVPKILVARAVEHAILRGLTTEGALRRRLYQVGGPGCPGSGTLRRVLDERPKGKPARSGFEVITLDVLREAGMKDWLRNYTVTVEGVPVAEIDLADPERMIAVEPNGARWHSTRRAVERDRKRIALLRSLGWNVIETDWDEVIRHPERLIARVRAAFCGSPAPIGL
jgi:hypothetical protein